MEGSLSEYVFQNKETFGADWMKERLAYIHWMNAITSGKCLVAPAIFSPNLNIP